MGKGKKIILVACIIIFVCTSALLVKYAVNEYNNKKMYDELSNLISTTESAEDDVPDYAALYAKNSDFVGWISVPNTSINYPVLQCDNNDFYLEYNFEKNKDARGAIFMDSRNDAVNLDSNTIIYGHNCYNTTMFSELTKYESIDFYWSIFSATASGGEFYLSSCGWKFRWSSIYLGSGSS